MRISKHRALAVSTLAWLAACSRQPEPQSAAGVAASGAQQGPEGAAGAAEAGAVARREGPAMTPQAAEAYAQGVQAFAAGDLKGAEAQFNRAISLDPQAYPAIAALGVVHERRGEVSRALDMYGKAASIAPDFG